jgi:hypothetical protein
VFVIRSLQVELLAACNFWRDICRSSKSRVLFYHSQNTAIAKNSFVEGLPPHRGTLNDVMNNAIFAMCREFPLNLLTYPKAHMINHGAGNLLNLKSRIIDNIAENIVRYVRASLNLHYISLFIVMSSLLPCVNRILIKLRVDFKDMPTKGVLSDANRGHVTDRVQAPPGAAGEEKDELEEDEVEEDEVDGNEANEDDDGSKQVRCHVQVLIRLEMS